MPLKETDPEKRRRYFQDKQREYCAKPGMKAVLVARARKRYWAKRRPGYSGAPQSVRKDLNDRIRAAEAEAGWCLPEREPTEPYGEYG